MARKPRPELVEAITKLNSEGLLDSEIAQELNIRPNLANHYRHKILGLEPNWIKRDFTTPEQKTIGYILRNVRYSAKRRNIPYDLEMIDLTVPSHCPLLGIPIDYRDFTVPADFNNNNWATVDRIDNEKGYIRGNVWIISRLANNMKNSASLDQLETFAKAILLKIENHRALGSVTDPEGLDS